MNSSSEKLRIVMMGDSITFAWSTLFPAFFDRNGLMGRGVVGQTSGQMLRRFREDVLEIKPQLFHLMGGINDIAENGGVYDPAITKSNLESMASQANDCGIKVIVASVTPATSFAWYPALGNRQDEIVALNDWIRDLCVTQGFVYCDYWSILALPDGSLKPELGLDSVHPNAAGYAAMEPVILTAIEAALGGRDR